MSGALVPISPFGHKCSDLLTNAINLGPSRVIGQPCCTTHCEAGKWELGQCQHHPSVSSQAQCCPQPSSLTPRLAQFVHISSVLLLPLHFTRSQRKRSASPGLQTKVPKSLSPHLLKPIPMEGARRRLLPSHKPFPQLRRVLE